jgi:hypothetical protein
VRTRAGPEGLAVQRLVSSLPLQQASGMVIDHIPLIGASGGQHCRMINAWAVLTVCWPPSCF